MNTTLWQLLTTTTLIFRSPDGGGAGGGGSDSVAAGSGDDSVAGGGGDDSVAGGGGDDVWYEKYDFGDEGKPLREHLVKSGFHKAETPEAAFATVLKAHMSAETKIGAPADRILELPGEGVTHKDWRIANAEKFGIPTGEDGYGWELGELPEGMFWDPDREKALLDLAKTSGVPKDAVSDIMDGYRDMMKADYEEIVAERDRVRNEMNATLTKDWGGNVSGNLAVAQRAMHHFANEAKIPPESVNPIISKMMDGTEIKDAQMARWWFAVGKAMGEDTGAGDILAGGGGGFGGAATRTELTTKKAQLMDEAKGATDQRQREIMKDVSAINAQLAKMR